ncbi:hypothetical protein G6708_06235 [Polynucleobacter paneuropaeus]|jgi:hypothetical protein|nr:hypothetical protein [Polynucleobacter paneuropaeus]QWD12560.1 hypothetical protein G6704_08985 [Polynucleobacter paneuropaeus]
MKLFVYQIFYNNETQKKILSGFIPLDNTKNLRPDWFEFWVILNFLRNNTLDDDAWYGFLSPRFYEKTGFNSDFVIKAIENYGALRNVALFSPGWDQLAYFLNPFEQGEAWHPGLMAASQDFLNKCQLEINLNTLVSDASSSVFSNYIIAKKEFWIQWRKIAEQFFEYVENNPEHLVKTSYGSLGNQFPMKTFIQERLASMILSTNTFKVLSPDQSFSAPIFTRMFPDDIKTRRLLQACDLMKTKYRESKDEKYLEMYWRIRGDIQYSNLRF